MVLGKSSYLCPFVLFLVSLPFFSSSLPPLLLLFFSQHLPGVLECLVKVQEEEVPDLEMIKTAGQQKHRENEVTARNSGQTLWNSCHSPCGQWRWMVVFGAKLCHGLWLRQNHIATSAVI